MKKGNFYYGTSGWSYKDWVGPFYPKGTSESDFLKVYAKTFKSVEVDSTYYRIPSIQMTSGWNKKTPDDFIFSPKMVGEVTHKRFLKDCDEVVHRFLEAMKPLGKKLGPILLQFPYFKKKEGVTLDGFLERLIPFLDQLPEGPRFAVEVRNKTFLKPELLEALIARNTALVLIDHVWMPRPEELLEMDGIFTADYLPVRLLGDRYGIEKITTTWGKNVVSKSQRLKGWAKAFRHALNSGLDVHAYTNNHYEGHAPASVRQLVEFLQG